GAVDWTALPSRHDARAEEQVRRFWPVILSQVVVHHGKPTQLATANDHRLFGEYAVTVALCVQLLEKAREDWEERSARSRLHFKVVVVRIPARTKGAQRDALGKIVLQ